MSSQIYCLKDRKYTAQSTVIATLYSSLIESPSGGITGFKHVIMITINGTTTITVKGKKSVHTSFVAPAPSSYNWAIAACFHLPHTFCYG